MSDIVQMTTNDGDYHSGHIYRLRSREADQLEIKNELIVLESQPEPSNTEEGV